MPDHDPRIDAYIEKAQLFAQPILKHLRQLVHDACPDVIETMKWSMPFFDYKGPLCNMASFKAHCSFGFWKGALLSDPNGVLEQKEDQAMGSFGRITDIRDLPNDKILRGFIQQAAQINDDGIKVIKPAKEKPAATTLQMPEILTAALRENKTAATVFEQFTPGKKKEYIEWINDAKTEKTRNSRLATAITWISEGKARNWQYQK